MPACRFASLISILALTFAGPAFAQKIPPPAPLAEGRPCAYPDVVGLWSSRVVTAKETGVEAHYRLAPHDYLRVRPDGGMMYFGSSRAEADVSEIHKRLDDYDRRDGVTYSAEVASPGLLLLRRDGAPFQGFTCTVVAPREGRQTLIWSQLKGQPELRRVQIRLD